MGRIKGAEHKNKLPIRSRLYSKVQINDETNCWEMNANKGARYPILQIGRKSVRANRLSWELSNNTKIPDGYFCLHKCDNTLCINPEHLFIGTHKDNMQDMIKKGRSRYDGPKGERCAQHKLTNEQVIEIKKILKNKVNITEVASKYGVSDATIYYIKNKKTWKHLEV